MTLGGEAFPEGLSCGETLGVGPELLLKTREVDEECGSAVMALCDRVEPTAVDFVLGRGDAVKEENRGLGVDRGKDVLRFVLPDVDAAPVKIGLYQKRRRASAKRLVGGDGREHRGARQGGRDGCRILRGSGYFRFFLGPDETRAGGLSAAVRNEGEKQPRQAAASGLPSGFTRRFMSAIAAASGKERPKISSGTSP